MIFGPDLVYREGEGWIGQRDQSHDKVVKQAKDGFAELVKNTYRVLLSRGMQGCYVHFMDAETQAYWESRMKPVSGRDATVFGSAGAVRARLPRPLEE